MSEIRLETSRLVLRPMALSDSVAVLEYRSHAEINRFQGWIPKCIEDVHYFIKHRISPEFNRPGTWFQMVIVRKDNGELIGDLGIHFTEEQSSQVELGVTLAKAQHRQGFATEALKEVIDHLFLKIGKRKIVVSIDPRNESSIKLFQRLGFEQEALVEKSYLLNGEWVDDLVYAVLKDEWTAFQG